MSRRLAPLVALTLLAGCAAEGPDKDFWGNPVGGDTCAVPGQHNIEPPRGHPDLTDPTKYLLVLAVVTVHQWAVKGRAGGCSQVIRPFKIHLYAQTNQGPGAKIETGRELPWTNNDQPLLTPKTEWMYVPLAGTTSFEARLIATHETDRNMRTEREEFMQCAFFTVRHGRLILDSKEIETERTTVNCHVKVNM